eukprot:516280-Alexandrium_andersonii.AAC.1
MPRPAQPRPIAGTSAAHRPPRPRPKTGHPCELHRRTTTWTRRTRRACRPLAAWTTRVDRRLAICPPLDAQE